MRTTLRPALRRALIFSAELVLGPMVPMMEVRRYSLAGWYSVFSCESHSIRVRPAFRWSRALAMSVEGSILRRQTARKI
jgi:hypothetical protein